MSSFSTCPQFLQSLKMRSACDRVLCSVFGATPDKIERFTKDSEDAPHILDKDFAIDLKVELSSGAQITGQEKTLSYSEYKYGTFTTEYYQNHNTKEQGEFFSIASQFYLHGYSDISGEEFVEWHIYDMLRLSTWINTTFDKQGMQANLRKAYKVNGRASFWFIQYDKIPKECELAGWRNPNTTSSLSLDFTAFDD